MDAEPPLLHETNFQYEKLKFVSNERLASRFGHGKGGLRAVSTMERRLRLTGSRLTLAERRLASPREAMQKPPTPSFCLLPGMGGRMRVRPTESHANPVAPCQWEHERIDYNPKHALIPPVKGGNDSVLGRSPGAIATSASGPPMWPCNAVLPYGRWPMPPSSVRVSPFMYLKSGPHS